MAYTVLNTQKTADVTMSSVYAEHMLALMEKDSRVMQLEADLARSVLGIGVIEEMQKRFPKQYVDCGIQEANMISVAAGLSVMGRIPFAHTFAPFASRRVADQTFISGSYADANVRILASDPGVTAQLNGGTHMPFEDVGIYRTFPKMTIIEPSDAVMLGDLVDQLASLYGMFYIRFFRKNAQTIYAEGSTFEIGKANMLRDGSDVTIIASGVIMIPEALKAADILKEEGISARVLDMFTIKPLDEYAVIAAALETGAIVTAENHNVINGLGSAVADVLATRQNAPLEKVGVADQFGQVGPLKFLMEYYHLTAADIAAAAKRAIARKK